jgi:hypothetical protein
MLRGLEPRLAGDCPAHVEHHRRDRYRFPFLAPKHAGLPLFLVLGILTVVESGNFIKYGGDSNSFVDFARPYFSMCLVTTLLATVLIVFRILWLTRDHAGTAFSGYRAIVEMVVESALLYSITLIIYIVSCRRLCGLHTHLPKVLLFGPETSNNDGYAQAILIQMTVRGLSSCDSAVFSELRDI